MGVSESAHSSPRVADIRLVFYMFNDSHLTLWSRTEHSTFLVILNILRQDTITKTSIPLSSVLSHNYFVNKPSMSECLPVLQSSSIVVG